MGFLCNCWLERTLVSSEERGNKVGYVFNECIEKNLHPERQTFYSNNDEWSFQQGLE